MQKCWFPRYCLHYKLLSIVKRPPFLFVLLFTYKEILWHMSLELEQRCWEMWILCSDAPIRSTEQCFAITTNLPNMYLGNLLKQHCYSRNWYKIIIYLLETWSLRYFSYRARDRVLRYIFEFWKQMKVLYLFTHWIVQKHFHENLTIQ